MRAFGSVGATATGMAACLVIASMALTACAVGDPSVTSSAGSRPPTAQRATNPRTIQVLSVAYYPTGPDGRRLDLSVTGDVGDAVSDVKAHVASVTANLAEGLSLGSAYRGFADPSAPRELAFDIVASLEFDMAVPSVASDLNPAYPRRADYPSILTTVGVCDFVARGVDEVWIWAYQGPHQLDISESRMSGPHGDISNSYRLDDLPDCGRTYLVYTYNYGRGTAEAVEDHGHQIEAMLTHIDGRLFRDLFEGPAHPATLGGLARCGSVHNPPNARFEYDRANPAGFASDCGDWTPDGFGRQTRVSCADWGCADLGDADNPALNYQVWWMQHLPGLGNRVIYQGRPLRDWWDVYADFDAVMASESP